LLRLPRRQVKGTPTFKLPGCSCDAAPDTELRMAAAAAATRHENGTGPNSAARLHCNSDV